MGINAQDVYLESRIFSASPVELVQILYESAIGSVEKARGHLKNGEIAARSREISQASAILLELAASLNRDAEPGLAQNLLELYDYMGRRLIDANFRQEEAPLAEVSKLLGTLLEGWVACRPELAQGPVTAQAPDSVDAPPPEEVGEYVSQSWTA
jgi:flagellar secretion chaperone FliS